MRKLLLPVLLLLAATPALGQPMPPEITLPPTGTDVWGPLKYVPDPAPDVDWARLTAGCTRRFEKSVDEGTERISGETHAAYDKAGRMVKHEKYESGKVESTTTFTYDEKGQLKNRTEKYAGSGSINAYTLTHDYEYDAQGRISKITKQESGYPATVMVLGYDAAGNFMKQMTQGPKGESGWVVERSKTGAAISLVTVNPEGVVDRLYDGTADAQGRLARLKQKGGNEDVLTYDAAGRVATQTTTAPDGGKETVKKTYDAAGRLSKIESTTTNASGGGDSTRVLGYDAKGHLISNNFSRHRNSGDNSSTEVRDLTYTWEGDRLVGEKEKFGGQAGHLGFSLDAGATYTYDGKGRLSEVRSHAEGYPPLKRTKTTTYSY